MISPILNVTMVQLHLGYSSVLFSFNSPVVCCVWLPVVVATSFSYGLTFCGVIVIIVII